MILGVNKNPEEEFFDNTKKDKTWIPTPRPTPRPNARPNAICCPNCGKDTGLSNPFMMVIMPPGLKCAGCGEIVIHSSSMMFY